MKGDVRRLSFVATVAQSLRARVAGEVRRLGYEEEGSIPGGMSFRAWCQELANRGMKVDQKPFNLEDRPALVPIYDAIPTTREEAFNRFLIVQKATQLGLTVWEVLADIYMALKWSPVNIGLFLPDQALASFKSDRRFMPLVRSVPELLRFLTYRPEEDGTETKVGEGNILTRAIGASLLMFLWTSGKGSTESRPMDIVSLDELQNMLLVDIEKVIARVGDSDVQFKLMLSTANMPDADINYWYKLGTQEVWHTRCLTCEALSDLSDPDGTFPSKSIAYNTGDVPRASVAHDGGQPPEPPVNEYVWTCPHCRHHISNPQIGEYVSQNRSADSKMRSFMLPRTISPRITPRAMFDGWMRATSGTLKKNFYNRTLARTYLDPNQVPVTLAHCEACVEEGRRAGVTWMANGTGMVMGIDQMGEFNCIVIKRRMPDGRQAVAHVEAVFDPDPFKRAADLMGIYGIACCVVEQLPNVNDARKFANQFRGRVFLAHYSEGQDMIHWGDALDISDRKTAVEDRSRYQVVLNRYKAMQWALFKVRDRQCLFPNPIDLEQDYVDDGKVSRTPILAVVFKHFTKTGLVVETDEKTLKRRPNVLKIGIDPHFSFANMLCDVAWARSNGNTMMILPDVGAPGAAAGAGGGSRAERVAREMPGLPAHVVDMLADLPPDVCGRCANFEPSATPEMLGRCKAREMLTGERDPSCILYEPLPGA